MPAGRHRARLAARRAAGEGGRGKLVELTTQSKPEAATHWSTRKLAARLGVSASVLAVWRANGLKPHLVQEFQGIARSEVRREARGHRRPLYVAAGACLGAVLRREESGAGAGSYPARLPLKKGRAETMTHDYKRNGTTTLFAAMSTLDGSVISRCASNVTAMSSGSNFLRQIDRETPKDKALHLVCDNYATHKHPKVQGVVGEASALHMHFTPTSASWLNMVERFFRRHHDRSTASAACSPACQN
jgi:hypothetical protein